MGTVISGQVSRSSGRMPAVSRAHGGPAELLSTRPATSEMQRGGERRQAGKSCHGAQVGDRRSISDAQKTSRRCWREATLVRHLRKHEKSEKQSG